MAPTDRAADGTLKSVALLIGGTGFVGRHLRAALEQDYQVISTGRGDDIRDERRVEALVATAKPQVLVNLAALTTVRETVQDPLNTYRTGFLGSLGTLNALKNSGFTGTYLNISSSEVYGYPDPAQLPMTELTALRPMSPYAVNKIATDALCHQWSKTERFKLVTARPFTHIGPGQSDRFAISNFGKQLAEIAKGMRPAVMRVGNLHATRDISDVRDVVQAYVRLINGGDSGEIYNVCSGTEVSIQSLLDQLIAHSGLQITIETDPALARSTEQDRILGSHAKLTQQTGWTPQIPMRTTLTDIYDHWLAHTAP